MEPLFDKLARQDFVKKLVATIRGWDKRSDQWVLSIPLKWRILVIAAIMGTVMFAIGAIEAMRAICLVLYLFGYVFFLANFCLIVTARQSTTFKLVNLGSFRDPHSAIHNQNAAGRPAPSVRNINSNSGTFLPPFQTQPAIRYDEYGSSARSAGQG